jgi:hypothetical protein
MHVARVFGIHPVPKDPQEHQRQLASGDNDMHHVHAQDHPYQRAIRVFVPAKDEGVELEPAHNDGREPTKDRDHETPRHDGLLLIKCAPVRIDHRDATPEYDR